MSEKKCYIYLRVSTSMQVEGFSLEAQRERLTKFAEFQHMEIVREYCDAGKSGKSISGRPEFSRMLQDIADGFDDVDYILVFKLSRFGRNAADVLNSLQFIQDYGVNLICVEDGIDSSKDSGKLTITVLSAVAEIERENILVQTMEGRKQKAREGKWNGGHPPYGYRIDKEKQMLVVEPSEAEVVKLIFRKYAYEKEGLKEIARYLNSHGYKKEKLRETDNDFFVHYTVKNILKNPVYIGKLTFGKTTTEKIKGTRDQYHRVNTDDYLVTDGLHDPIIDMETWEKAQDRLALMAKRFEKRHLHPHEHILSGLLKCPICGDVMTGTVRRRRNKKVDDVLDYYYRCHHRVKVDGDKLCDFSLTLNEQEMDAEVEAVILHMVNDADFGGFVMEKIAGSIDVEVLKDERDNLLTQLKQSEGAKDKLMETMDALDVTDRHYKRKYQDMQKRLEGLYDKINTYERSLQELNKKIAAANDDKLTVEELNLMLNNFEVIYEKMTELERKQFMNKLVEKVEILPEKREDGSILKSVEFRFPLNYNDGRNGTDNEGIQLPNQKTVETVCLLCNQNAKPTKWAHVSLSAEEYLAVKKEIEEEKKEKG